jgi:hypothetical protein
MNLQTQERSQSTQSTPNLSTQLWGSIKGTFTAIQSRVSRFITGTKRRDINSQHDSAEVNGLNQETSTTSNSESNNSGGTSAALPQVIENPSQRKNDTSPGVQLQQENTDLDLSLEALPITDRPEFLANAEPDLQSIAEVQNRELYDLRATQLFEEQIIQEVDRATQPEIVPKHQVEQQHLEAAGLEQQLHPQIKPDVAKLDQLDQHVHPQIQPEVRGLDQPVNPQLQPPDVQAKTQPLQPPTPNSPAPPAQPASKPQIDEPVLDDYKKSNAEIVDRLNSLLDHTPKGKLIAETTWVTSSDQVVNVYHRAAAQVKRVTNYSSQHDRYESLIAAKLIHEVGYNKAAEAIAAGSQTLNHINRTQGARAAATYLQEQLQEGRHIMQTVQKSQPSAQRGLRKPTS